ncbi:hypothetical protein KFE25_004431 [Diacronema lutheri]|uniref:J domain-containing protein n=2 Tax=Diacronema lutheri TaxID=2081491 RepID=A0A8J5XB07_DIALT|nr:hypothetical protein KFE25_004431 [Diacronema lutheri]
MPVDLKHYRELGVAPDASEDAIKKAYRKLALQHHPDKGGDPEKFKAISTAFAVLSDPEKRAAYDRYGEGGAPPGFGGGGMPGGGGRGGMPGFTFASGGADIDPHEIFAAFFGSGAGGLGGGLGGGRGGGGFRRAGGRAFGGGMGGMGGLGGMGGMGGMGGSPFFEMPGFDTSSDSESPHAGGHGRAHGHGTPKPPPVTRELQLTLEELYAGVTKRLRVTRRVRGQAESKVLEIEAKPGWKAGTKVTFAGEGDDGGDLVFVIGEKAHARFRRAGDDLEVHAACALADLLRGKAVDVPHLDPAVPPATVRLDALAPDQNGRLCVRVVGRGMPLSSAKRERGGGRAFGDLLVVAHVDCALPAAQRDAVRAALGA